jgi:branched-chain amino acid transport system ATP-binding protein
MPDVLCIERLSAGYGEAIVLHELSVSLPEGQSLSLLGRNGMGKTTLINSIVGVTTYIAGRITLLGRDLARLRPDQRAHAGIGWVPQERNIFRSLTVEENLTAIARPGAWTLDRVYQLFPRLAERRRNLGTQLSGGEQQMLAVARALVLNPRLMLLDEPLEGLAPILVQELLAALQRIVREEGSSAIVVEQNAQKVLAITDRAAIIQRGVLVHEGPSRELAANRDVLESYLGVTGAVSRRTAARPQ